MTVIHEQVGAVAIGRNEGERLKICLKKLVKQFSSVVYVDSGSSDGSIEFARAIGVVVTELDTSIPFNAARARNSGWQTLLDQNPNLEFIQFVDGDCELVDGWLETSLAAINASPVIAIVCGRRREKFPKQSIYNRIMDLEWDTPVGRAQSCGGDSLVRIQALSEVGGFNETVQAGEEPEMCMRLRKAGWEIYRIDAEMTVHDSAMTRFSQWWRRQRRSGYGALDVNKRLGVQSFSQELRSARIWTLGWIGASLGLAILLSWNFGIFGFWLGILTGCAAFGAQIVRLTLRQRRVWDEVWNCAQYAWIMMISKFANMHGQILWWLDRWRGRHLRQIEYKSD
ncbi:glycosyltransferase [Pirellulaceae bacterium SH467]